VLRDSGKSPGSFEPLHRFKEYVSFTPSEVKEIQALGDKPIVLPRSSVIREQEVIPTCFFILLDGWASSSVEFENGDRQITKVHLPGDLMGAPSASLAQTADSLTALTRVVVSRIPLERFGQLFATRPRFAAAMFLSAQRERVALIDALTRVGRTSSAEKLASLMLDLYERLSAAGCAQELQFELPLTQQEIGDILGISTVHVSRSFKEIEDLGLLKRAGRKIKILDLRSASVFARWSHRPAASKFDWLIDHDVS